MIKRIKQSNIGHRFNEKMYRKFVEYIETYLDKKLLNKVKNDKTLDIFYIFVIKMCVINSEYSIYPMYKNNFDTEIQINIINELSKHDELMKSKNIIEWIDYIRYNHFMKQDCFPENLNISFRSLLLTNINSMVVLNYVSERQYLFTNCIGAYLLIKLQELSVKTQKQKRIKEVIRKAFIASNMNVVEYINVLEKECKICNCAINYVQKEKMKEYLLKTF